MVMANRSGMMARMRLSGQSMSLRHLFPSSKPIKKNADNDQSGSEEMPYLLWYSRSLMLGMNGYWRKQVSLSKCPSSIHKINLSILIFLKFPSHNFSTSLWIFVKYCYVPGIMLGTVTTKINSKWWVVIYSRGKYWVKPSVSR